MQHSVGSASETANLTECSMTPILWAKFTVAYHSRGNTPALGSSTAARQAVAFAQMKPTPRNPQATQGADAGRACGQSVNKKSTLMRRGMSRPAVVSVLSLALIATAGVASPAISATPQFRPAVAPASLKDVKPVLIRTGGGVR